jgi:hypothetical protein
MSELDDLKLPPRRPLPAEAHDRMRATVLDGLHSPGRSRAHRTRPPLAVAATVAVLAAGAAIVTQSVSGDSGTASPVSPNSSAPTVPAPPKAPPLDVVAARTNLDRCWSAVQQAGKAASVPARDTWTAVFAVPNEGRTLTAVRADTKPMFCETTAATVTVSDPNATPVYATGSTTGALIMSADGATGGVADPTWLSLDFVDVGQSGASGGGPAIVQDGFFVWFNGFAKGPGARSTVRQTVPGHPETPLPVPVGGVSTAPKPGEPEAGRTHAELDLPAAPAALVTMTDRPGPAQDRTSESGKFLGECLAKSDTVVVDPARWAPVIVQSLNADRYALARNGDQFATCQATEEHLDPNDVSKTTTYYQFMPTYGDPRRAEGPIEFSRWLPGPGHYLVVVGALRAGVATMDITDSTGNTFQAQVASGGFSAALSGQWPQDSTNFTAVLRGSGHNVIYEGPIPDSF